MPYLSIQLLEGGINNFQVLKVMHKGFVNVSLLGFMDNMILFFWDNYIG